MKEVFEEMGADTFYNMRDERTALIVGTDTRSHAALTLGMDTAEAQTFSGQLCFLLLVNMCARWCRHIGFLVDDVRLHPKLKTLFGSDSIHEAAIGVAHSADPFGSFLLQPLENPSSYIHVGLRGPRGAFPVFGGGWIASAGEDFTFPRSVTDTNPLGPAFAAALGACHALREALSHRNINKSNRLSLWNFGSGSDAVQGHALEPFDLGRILIVGTGAIGSNLAYLLPLLPARIATADLIDADFVDLTNLNRSLLFTCRNFKVPKVEAVATHFQRFGISTSVTRSLFSDSLADLGSYDLVFPGANEHGVQQSMMSNYPPLMIGASTGTQWDIHLQRHVPIVDDCLECRIPSEKPRPALRCSSGDFVVESDPGAPRITGALPFLSFAASLLALAEVAKLSMPRIQIAGENGVILFFKVLQPSFMSFRYEPKKNCPYCWNPDTFSRLRSATRFFSLSTRR